MSTPNPSHLSSSNAWCGVVYVAERTEPVRRCVALRVIRLSWSMNDAEFHLQRASAIDGSAPLSLMTLLNRQS